MTKNPFSRPLRTLALACALVSAACSSGGDSGPPEERIVVGEGVNLRLLRFANGKLVEVDRASIPTTGLIAGHTIFGVMKHPTQNWLYTTSFNECGTGEEWCWGNARIDRFTVGKGGIQHAGLVFSYDAASELACALEDWGYEGQVGGCAPVNGTFSADGTRLYVKEDYSDNLTIFSVAANGAVTLIEEGTSTDLHGMAAHPTLPYVYNGGRVLSVEGDTGALVTSAINGGNDTVFLDVVDGDDLLFTTVSNSTVGFYSLADPAAPVALSTVALGSSTARAAAYDAATGRVVAVGRNYVTSLTFDGATLAKQADFYVSDTENRSVALVDGGAHAVVSWFVNTAAAPSGALGGLGVYAIAEDGAITAGEKLVYASGARVVQSYVLP